MTPRETGLRLTLLVAAILLAVVALELACRTWQGPRWLLQWPNLVTLARIDPLREHWSFYAHDPDLGYVPQPRLKSPTFNVHANGFRQMPDARAGGPPVLAMGDSFTEGYEVGDDETWPAYLQQRLGRSVVNAGVSGYSLAQTVLRTERLVASVRPAVVVVAFIADDLWRGELSGAWGYNMPWFEPAGETLVLRGVPVPPSRDPRETLSVWQRALGWSMLASVVANRLDLADRWFAGVVRVLPEGTGARTACPLMQRLAALGPPMLIVAQYDADMWGPDRVSSAEQRRLTGLVLGCARDAGLATLDLFDVVGAAVGAHGRDAIYRRWHHGPDGNRITAEAIAEGLRQHHLLP
jgi:hypothetical protein